MSRDLSGCTRIRKRNIMEILGGAYDDAASHSVGYATQDFLSLIQNLSTVSNCKRVVARFNEPGGVGMNGPNRPLRRSVIMAVTANTTFGSFSAANAV